MKRVFLLLVAMMALNATLSAQVFIDARSMGIYYGEPRMVTMKDDANNDITVHFDRDGKVTSFEYGGSTMTFSWRPDGKRITVTQHINGESMSDYINVIEYSDSVAHYEAGGMTMKIVFDSLNRITQTELSTADTTAKMEYTYAEGSTSSVPLYIVATNNYGQRGEQQVTSSKCDSEGNYTEFTALTYGFETTSKRKIYYY